MVAILEVMPNKRLKRSVSLRWTLTAFAPFSRALDMTKSLALIGNILALFIYGVALLSPLTPSDGMPGVGVLLSCVCFPLLLLLHAWRTYGSMYTKIGVVLEAAVMVGFTSWLLLIQSGNLLVGS